MSDGSSISSSIPNSTTHACTIPKHVAIIMDGNRRWAQKNNLRNKHGYQEGLERMSEIILKSFELKISTLTFFALSKENWNREKADVATILSVLDELLTKSEGMEKIEHWIKKGAKIVFIGNLSKLPTHTQAQLNKVQKQSVANSAMLIQVAISYSGRDDIVSAAEKLVNKLLFEHILDAGPVKIDEDQFATCLMTNNVADPDFLIRTGNEKRISNFMIWQISYCELFFSEKMWPEFTVADFEEAIKDYQLRSRRYGVK